MSRGQLMAAATLCRVAVEFEILPDWTFYHDMYNGISLFKIVIICGWSVDKDGKGLSQSF